MSSHSCNCRCDPDSFVIEFNRAVEEAVSANKADAVQVGPIKVVEQCRRCESSALGDKAYVRLNGACSGKHSEGEIDAGCERDEHIRRAIGRVFDLAFEDAIVKARQLASENKRAIDESAPVKVSVKFNFTGNFLHRKLSRLVATAGNFLKGGARG